MNKLIELLNQCLEEQWKEYRFRRIVDNDFFEIWEDTWLWYETIFSKKYWFIKWLVDNDKIDLLKLDNRIALSEFNKVERVLMALSIQNNPIEFLCSVLK